MNEFSVDRSKTIVKTSVLGIIANVLLASFKLIFGLLSSSIAIVLDAVNNVSDVASSTITLVGAKIATKAADKKHPFGHGRVEYLSAMIIAALILYAGITALVESIKKIITPQTPDYSLATLIIVGVAVAVKIGLGIYFLKVGKKVRSDALVNSGKDALTDSVISAATLIAAIVFTFAKVSTEAWLGAIISLFIIRAGLSMLISTLSRVLGKPPEKDLILKIKETVNSFPDVSGVFDLILNDYGPDIYNGSMHIGVPAQFNAEQIDELEREIAEKVYREHHVIITAIGVYSINTSDQVQNEMRQRIVERLITIPNVLQIHGFFVNKEKKYVRFDMVVDFEQKDRIAVVKQAEEQVKALYPDYSVRIVIDNDYGEF